MAQMAGILLLIFLARSMSGCLTTGKCFTTIYIKKQWKRKLDSLNEIKTFFFGTRNVSEHLLSQAKSYTLSYRVYLLRLT